jgi:hypothetical protein
LNKEEIQSRIVEIEIMWKTEISKPLSGGLNSKINQELLQLRNDLKNAG